MCVEFVPLFLSLWGMEGLRNVSFTENVVYLLSRWSLFSLVLSNWIANFPETFIGISVKLTMIWQKPWGDTSARDFQTVKCILEFSICHNRGICWVDVGLMIKAMT